MAAAKNWYLTGTTANSWRTVDEATQAATLNTDGWIVSTTGDSTTSSYAVGVERAATTFSGSTQPDGTLDTSLFDAFRTTNAYSGSFASANWTFSAVVRAVTSAGTHTGAVVIRLLRSVNADGSGATQITAAQQTGTTTAAMAATGTNYTSTVTFNPGAFSLTNEYLFFQIAWKRIAAGGMTSSDANWMKGSSASVGTRIASSTFTPEHPTTGALVGTGKVIAGTALNFTVLSSTGPLIGSGTVLDGAALHNGRPITTALTDDGLVTVDTTPTLQFVGTDPENDGLRYQIQIDNNSAFSSPELDKISGTDAGFVGETNGDTDPFDCGSGVIDSYSDANVDAALGLGSDTYTECGQSFAAISSQLDSATFNLRKVGVPSGPMVARIYAHDGGTYGSGGKPTGSALAESESIDISTLTETGANITFPFLGSNRNLLAADTHYCAVVHYDSTTLASGDFLRVAVDNSTPTHGGNAVYYSVADGWAAGAFDCSFAVSCFPVVSYTVQAGDALASGTWYWRVRAKDPGGTDQFSSWTTGRSLTIGAGTHDVSGSLTGHTTIAGTAQHKILHTSSGILAGSGKVIAGTATNFTVHATSGVLSKSATLAGVAARTRVHATTSGALIASGKVVVGSANRTRAHAATGILTGAGKVIAGTSRRFRAHATTSVLAGAGKIIAGTALNFSIHASSGILAGTGKVIAGTAGRSAGAVTHAATGAIAGAGKVISATATRTRAHANSGILAATGKVVSGSAARARIHASASVLPGKTATIAGSAQRGVGAVSHPTTGTLAGSGKIVSGIVARSHIHAANGVLAASGKVINGTVARNHIHAASGVLAGHAALAGTARHLARHAATGALPGHFALLAASAQHAGAAHNALGNLTGGEAIVVSAVRLADLYASSGVLAGSIAFVAGSASRLPPMGVQPGGGARIQMAGRAMQSSQPRPAAISVAQRSPSGNAGRSNAHSEGIRRN